MKVIFEGSSKEIVALVLEMEKLKKIINSESVRPTTDTLLTGIPSNIRLPKPIKR